MRPAIQTQPPTTELGQVMTMLKSMQASIAALEAKQRGLEAPRAPVQVRTEESGRPWRAQPETRRLENRSGMQQGPSRPTFQRNQLESTNSVHNNIINNRNQVNQDAPEKSTNPDFPNLCKSMFRFVQLEHHLGNWKALPKGIDKALQKVITNIKPPMPSEGLSDRLLALTLDFKDSLTRAVHDHISDQLCKVKIESETLDNSDAFRARDIVEQQLKRKLGKKLSDNRRDELLTEALKVIKMPRPGLSAMDPVPPVVTLAGGTGILNHPVSTVEVVLESGHQNPARMLSYADVMSPELAATPSNSKKRRVTSPACEQQSLQEMEITVIASDDEEVDRPVSSSQKPGPLSSKFVNMVHRKHDVDKFTINFKTDCRVLVLGDSELKNLKGLPIDFQVESFSGARFPWLTEVVRRNSLPSSVTDVVLAAGINDRESSFNERTLPELKECLDELRKTGRKLHFLAVNIPKDFSSRLVNNLEDLNDYVRAAEDVGVIENLPYSSVRTLRDGLHYDDMTLDLITDKVKEHFLN